MKINALKFALAAGIWLGLGAVIGTIGSLIGIPGVKEFFTFLIPFYGPWGYSVSLLGILTGAILGFAEGFVHFGFLALIYNWLISTKKAEAPSRETAPASN